MNNYKLIKTKIIEKKQTELQFFCTYLQKSTCIVEKKKHTNKNAK